MRKERSFYSNAQGSGRMGDAPSPGSQAHLFHKIQTTSNCLQQDPNRRWCPEFPLHLKYCPLEPKATKYSSRKLTLLLAALQLPLGGWLHVCASAGTGYAASSSMIPCSWMVEPANALANAPPGQRQRDSLLEAMVHKTALMLEGAGQYTT